MTSRNVAGTEILLCRVAGQYFAVIDRCSHARQKLSEGRLRGYEISCPLHGARFDVRNGNCLAAPAINPVRTFEVCLEDDQIIVRSESAS